MFRTKLCSLLGIGVPILAAPMGFITGPELAAAVSNAGGLGIMSFSANPPPVLREQIRRLQTLTDKPFGVNVLLSGPRLPFSIDAVIDVCLEERVPVLSTFWGDPTPYVARAHSAGVKIIDQVGSLADAQRSAQAGVDAIVAQGIEAGGHIAGGVTTIALVPRVVDAVAPLPVAAAGGITDARGLVAALALGAQAVMIGTRLIATSEAYAHPVCRQKILAATEDQTVLTTLFGHGFPNAPHRTLRTPFVERWLAEEARGSEQRPDEPQIGERQSAANPFRSCGSWDFLRHPTPLATSIPWISWRGRGSVWWRRSSRQRKWYGTLLSVRKKSFPNSPPNEIANRLLFEVAGSSIECKAGWAASANGRN